MVEPVIAIDGPASSGKGTVARGVARALGFAYIDTGAMYRAVALRARERGVSWDDAPALGELAGGLDFAFAWAGDVLRVAVDGEDVTRAIRADDVGLGASRVSRFPAVRDALLGLQRGLAARGGVVMDGRDIGTVVLPDATVKIFLTATLDERARRRHEELLERGETLTYDEVRESIAARDRADSERAVAPLRAAEDAVVVDSTELAPRAVIDRVVALAARRRGAASGA